MGLFVQITVKEVAQSSKWQTLQSCQLHDGPRQGTVFGNGSHNHTKLNHAGT